MARIGRLLGLVLAWILFLFVLLQGAGWFAFDVAGIKPIGSYGYPRGLFAAHPQLGYTYTPGFSGSFSGEAYKDIPIRINSYGFRDVEPPDSSPSGTRIVALGDSVVFGAGVHRADRFTEQFSRAAGLQVLNMGVNSWTFGHYRELARLNFLGTQPSHLVLGLTLNDILPMESAGPLKRIGQSAKSGDADLFTRFRWWWDDTYTARFARELEQYGKAMSRSADESESYSSRWMRSIVAHWSNPDERRELEQQLDEFLQLTREQDLVALLFPEKNELQEPDAFGLPRQQLLKILSERQIPVCDPAADFRVADNLDALFLTGDSVHFTPEGHQLVAERLTQCIGEQGW